MSESNAYVNAYIDSAIGLIHEKINVVLQLKTQLKMANDIVAEKDSIIGSLASQLETIKFNSDEMSVLRGQAQHWEDMYNVAMRKAGQADTALNQLGQMKQELYQRDIKIALLEEKLNPAKKTINTKKGKGLAGNAADEVSLLPVAIAGNAADEVSNVPVAIAGNATDDF
jgi:hypothetical protein